MFYLLRVRPCHRYIDTLTGYDQNHMTSPNKVHPQVLAAVYLRQRPNQLAVYPANIKGVTAIVDKDRPARIGNV